MNEQDFAEINKDSQEKLKEDIAHYRNVLQYMGANLPIGALCLPKEMENLLLKSGFLRVYDLINCDLTKIKGFGRKRLDLLTSRLDEFISIQL